MMGHTIYELNTLLCIIPNHMNNTKACLMDIYMVVIHDIKCIKVCNEMDNISTPFIPHECYESGPGMN